jgi:hypothetical protein
MFVSIGSGIDMKSKRTLVDISLGLVRLLVELVSDGVLGGRGAGTEGGIGILGDVLVGFVGGLSTGALDGLGYVVCGVLERYVS